MVVNVFLLEENTQVAELTIVTYSEDKVYDGEALTADGTVTFDGTTTAYIAGEEVIVELAGDETITFKITGSQTPVGKSDNTYEMVLSSVSRKFSPMHFALIG